jgi:GGDEF-like domain
MSMKSDTSRYSWAGPAESIERGISAAARITVTKVTKARGDNGVDADSYVAVIAGRLSQQIDLVCARIQGAIEDRIPELSGNAQMIELLSASLRDNVATVLQALGQSLPVDAIPAPTTALVHARRIAQRAVPVNVIVRAYRLGQRRMTELVFAELHAITMDAATRVEVIERITTVLFEYVDSVSQQAVTAYESERERWLENKCSMRAMRVRDVLDQAADVDAAASAIHYPLEDHQHLALIVWYPSAGPEHDELDRLRTFLEDLGAAVETSARPLSVAADRTSGWAWLPFISAPGDVIAKVREFARWRPDPPRIAMGAVGSGVEGFRRSHRQAQRARTALDAGDAEQRQTVAATDPEVAVEALLGGGVLEAREWVADVLGELASDNDDDTRLREALWAYLHSGSGYEGAAKELDLGFHTVKRRVEQAVARRGRPIDNRLDVELALFVCLWYGADVLQSD